MLWGVILIGPFCLFCFAAQMRYLEKGKSSLFLNVPQAISALRATGNLPDSLLWLLHPVLYTDLQHSDSLNISLAGHYGVNLMKQLCVTLYP